MSPKTANYTSKAKSVDGIEVSYTYNPLRKKYRKYAERKDVKVVSVKIKNHTPSPIKLGRDFNLVSSSGNSLLLINSDRVYDEIKQKPATHLLYLLLSLIQLQRTTTNEFGQTETENIFPIGLIIGPGLAIGNFITANEANTKFKKELIEYDITNREIQPNEEVFGLISIRSADYPNIQAKLIK